MSNNCFDKEKQALYLIKKGQIGWILLLTS